MKFYLLTFIVLFTSYAHSQQFASGKELLQAMHKKYYKAPCKCYTFGQRNTHYKNDSVAGNSEWHEEINFPDRFRIIFGGKDSQNFVQFKNDSAYRYRDGKLLNSRADTNNLLLILGGMYYRPIDNVFARLERSGYDLTKIQTAKWKNEDVYVLGALEGDSTSNQLWIEKKDYKIVRIIERMNATETMDMRFESHQRSCKGFVENKVSFRRNGKLEQVEEYYDIKDKKCD
jgi:hypothetical protein